MGLREVKKELAMLEKEELIYHLAELYKKYKPVKAYFDFFANPDEEALLEKHKARVHDGFWPAAGKKLKLYRSRRSINEFKKIAVNPEYVADLLLYFAECAVQYAREKQPGQEVFYERTVNGLAKAIEYMDRYELRPQFEDRIRTLTQRCEDFPWDTQARMITLQEDH